MASVNKVIILGNCGRDAEVRYLPSGMAVANVSIATSSKRKDKQSGEMIEETQWHRVTLFDRLAEIAGEYVKKGNPIYIEGHIKYGKFTDKDGVEKNTCDIVASSLQLLGSRDGGGQREEGRQQQRPASTGGQRNEYQEQRGGGQRRAPAPSQQRPAAARPSSGFDDMDDDIPFLFNISTVSDTMGASKSKHRIKNGPKALHILRINQADF